jgi:hypothetical protein
VDPHNPATATATATNTRGGITQTQPHNTKKEAMELLDQSRECLKKGAIDKGKKLLKECVEKIVSLPEEEQWKISGEYEKIQETFARITIMERIIESYRKDPVKTQEYADILKLNVQARRKVIYKKLEEILA